MDNLFLAIMWYLLGVVALYLSYRVGYKRGANASEMSWQEFSKKYFGREDQN